MPALLVAPHCNVVAFSAPRRPCPRHASLHVNHSRRSRPQFARIIQSVPILRTHKLHCAVEPSIGGPEESDYDLLTKRVEELSTELQDSLKGTNVYLVGLMGTGKSTVGRMLSYCLKYCFFDSDDVIEKYHQGKTVAQIFEEDGEDYFRTCETEVLKQLSPYTRCVVATGGGIVEKPENWSYLQHGVVVWLDGSPELLAMRVIADGAEKRPLLRAEGSQSSTESALAATAEKLQSILERRKGKYANADLKVSVAGTGRDKERGAPPPVVNFRVMDALSKKIKETAKERADKANFTIEGLDELPSTIKVVPPAQDA